MTRRTVPELYGALSVILQALDFAGEEIDLLPDIADIPRAVTGKTTRVARIDGIWTILPKRQTPQ